MGPRPFLAALQYLDIFQPPAGWEVCRSCSRENWYRSHHWSTACISESAEVFQGVDWMWLVSLWNCQNGVSSCFLLEDSNFELLSVACGSEKGFFFCFFWDLEGWFLDVFQDKIWFMMVYEFMSLWLYIWRTTSRGIQHYIVRRSHIYWEDLDILGKPRVSPRDDMMHIQHIGKHKSNECRKSRINGKVLEPS